MNRRSASSSIAGSSGQPSDRELVGRCRLGDTVAWRALYDRYASAVYRFVAALGVPAQEREDAAQEIFVAVYRSLERFRGDAQLSTWVYRIAARHAARLGRSRRLRELLGALALREPAPPPPDPSERAADLHTLDRMIGRLGAKKRTVLVLFEIEGLDVDKIADIVGCPSNTVWSRLRHARADLLRMARRGTT